MPPLAADDDALDEQQAAQLGRLLEVHVEARELGERFAAASHELYLVGGTVRDALLSAEARPDLDFATSALPAQTEEILRGWADHVWDIGARFGTISAQKDGRLVEVTTYRSDQYTPGSRHPEVTFGDSIEGDLARRDFTVNAMAVRVPDFRFVDPSGGLQDLAKGLLRTPIEPAESFAADPLRIMRLARFAAVLDADPDPATEAAASAMAESIRAVSAERVRDELNKLVVGVAAAKGLDVLIRTGVAAQVVPEVAALPACVDPEQRHKDVYAHTLAVVANCEPEPILRLAALFHDVGKPDTRRIHRDRTVTFHHHEAVGARLTRERMRALRYDKQTVDDVTDLVFMHLRFHTYRMGWTDSAVRRYVRDAGHLLDRLNELTRADVTTANPSKAQRIRRRMDELEERITELREQEELEAMRPAIDGNQIMAHLGIDPGPLVGEAWNHLLELRIEHGPMSEEDALAALDEWWRERAPEVS
ncbi:MAG: CCA tRNA nucleotidyltransferase [Nitriliruptorales bacterium]